MRKIEIANESAELIVPDTGRQAAGQIAFANEARFTAAHFSEPLTTYGVGFIEKEDILAELDLIAPRVEVGRRFEFKSAANADEFLSETDDIRAIGGEFKRVQFKGTSVQSKTYNKGLTIRLDKDEDLTVPGAEERAVRRLVNRVFRNDLRRGYAALVAGATNTGVTWSVAAGKDPDLDVMADIDTGGDARGIDSNIVVYGKSAWLKRALAHRAQSSAGGFASAGIRTPEELAGYLGVDKVAVSSIRYQTGASTKAKAIGGAYVLMYYAAQMQDKDDPSNIKRFVTPTESGLVRVYRSEEAKFVDITVEHYSNIVVATALGLRMFTVS